VSDVQRLLQASGSSTYAELNSYTHTRTHAEANGEANIKTNHNTNTITRLF
jgi:hypothetical protein